MTRSVKRLLVGMICTLMALTCMFPPTYAMDLPASAQIVFVLDLSGSMVKNDPNRLAVDSISQMIYSMLSNVDVGFIAFGDDITSVVPLTRHDNRVDVVKQVQSIQYSGYTNAGAALQKAVELFTYTAEKNYIVILSDGEIAMKTPEETSRSLQEYNDAINAAQQKGISIFTIGLEDELADINNSIFDAAKQSGGKTYFAPTSGELQSTINTIMWQDLGFRKQSVASVTATGGEDRFTIKVPGESADTIRILLTGASPISNLGVNCTAAEMKVYSGKKYGIIELKKPQKQDIEVRFVGSPGDRVTAELVAEYLASPNAYVSYQDTEETNRYNRTASISITLLNAGNENDNLFSDNFFNGKDALLSINGHQESVKIINGAANFSRSVLEAQTLNIDMSLPYLDINWLNPKPLTVKLEAPPPLLVEKDYTALYALLIGLGIILFALLIAYRIRHKRSYESEIKHNFGFTGKLDVYMVWARGGEYEIPPFSFQLSQLGGERKINLAQIILSGNVQLEFPGSDKIWFYAGPERSLLVKNNSKAEIIFAGTVISCGGQLQLAFGQKIYISFQKDVDEIEIYYRNVKELPSQNQDQGLHYMVRG